jgi:hypothetical protein
MTTMLNLSRKRYGVIACFFLFITFFSPSAVAQTAISGIINTYTAVSALDPCGNKLTVSNTSGFQPGGTVLLIQMQGATINETNSSSYGTIINYGNAGAYEKAEIAGIEGNIISFTKNLENAYNLAGNVQMVSIPQYENVVVGGELTAAPWNGTTGGVLALEASGTVTLNADIQVNGGGFRGGGTTINNASGCNFRTNITGYFYSRNRWESAFKGEGIAKVILGKELGRGAQANGGGAGNDHNAGGGGGGNFGGGGIGGNNADPGQFTCRGYNPGLGGKTLNPSERIFMGGGGGGGHTNNDAGSAGGNGGGIIYMKANAMVGNSRKISANGITALDGFLDGMGGGGAGGSILLDIANFNAQNLVIEAKGGNGGNNDNDGAFRCFGPGGGGGGGVISLGEGVDPTALSLNVSKGFSGRTLNSRSACNGSSNGAADGGNGAILRTVYMPTGIQEPTLLCNVALPVDFIYFRAKAQPKAIHLQWATAREVNNNYFALERSEDGVHFYEIGREIGKGNFSGVAVYSSLDHNPLYGTAYYRIKQVDYDSRFAYTNVVAVAYSSEEMLMSIFPNPVQEQQALQVKIYTPVGGEATLRIYDMLGVEKHHGKYSLTKGTQTLELHVAGYAAGLYVVQLQIGSFSRIQKIKVIR